MILSLILELGDLELQNLCVGFLGSMEYVHFSILAHVTQIARA